MMKAESITLISQKLNYQILKPHIVWFYIGQSELAIMML